MISSVTVSSCGSGRPALPSLLAGRSPLTCTGRSPRRARSPGWGPWRARRAGQSGAACCPPPQAGPAYWVKWRVSLQSRAWQSQKASEETTVGTGERTVSGAAGSAPKPKFPASPAPPTAPPGTSPQFWLRGEAGFTFWVRSPSRKAGLGWETTGSQSTFHIQRVGPTLKGSF